MGKATLSTQAAPSTPGADTVHVYPDSTSELLTAMDDAGRVYPLIGTTGMISSADFTGTNVNTAQPVFDSALDAITVTANTAYLINACLHIHTTGTTNHSLGLLFGGTATITSIAYGALVSNAATEVADTSPELTWIAVATNSTVAAAAASATHHTVFLHGVVRINAAGTFIPQYQWSAAPGVAGVTLANSYFLLHPFGPGARTVIGSVA